MVDCVYQAVTNLWSQMSIVAFVRSAQNENAVIERFCENVWVDGNGDCVTVLELIIKNLDISVPLQGLTMWLVGPVDGLEIANNIYSNHRYCNWYYSRRGFEQVQKAPHIVSGDGTEFQVIEPVIEKAYIEERRMTKVFLAFKPVPMHERIGMMIRYTQSGYARRYQHQWTIDERIYDRKSVISNEVAIENHIRWSEVLPVTQGYVWVILPEKKVVTAVAPEARNLRHMEEDGSYMLGTYRPQSIGLRMMIHWRTGGIDGAWDAKRLSAVYNDQPLPYWMTWGAFILSVIGLILAVVSTVLVFYPPPQQGGEPGNTCQYGTKTGRIGPANCD